MIVRRIAAFILLQFVSVSPAFAQGTVLLVGGGSENYDDWSDESYRWLVQHAPNKKILVLDYSDSSSFLPGYFKFLGASSAANLVINSRSGANDSANYRAILQTGGLFLRGGDQWQYVSLWRGTLAEQAIRQVFQRGGAVGGASSGAMVLSEIVFDARTTSVDPRLALRNPLQAGITFTSDFLKLVPQALVDTHFYERGRLGRLAAMLAVYRAQYGKWTAGVGIDDRTALGISPDGSAEVFGSGVVALLRANEQTNFGVQPTQPLLLTGLQLRQFTQGFSFDLASGQSLAIPTSAASFAPAAFHQPRTSIFVEGGDQPNVWFAAAGSFGNFLSRFASSRDTIGILSSPASSVLSESIAEQLRQRGFAHHQFRLATATRNDLAAADSMRRCTGFIFVGNHLDSTASYLSANTAMGRAFRAATQAHAAILFLGNDAKLAGSTGIGQTEVSTTAAYRGRLTRFTGLDLLGSTMIMPRAFQNSDYHENRLSGLFWGIAKSNAAFGVFLDAGAHLRIENGGAEIFGRTPAIIIDAREAQWVDFSRYRASNSVGPRQSAALDHALLHILPNRSRFDFVNGSVVHVEETGEPGSIPSYSFRLEQNYPNPFNPNTVIRYHLDRPAKVSLRIFNLQGKELLTLVEAEQIAGDHAVHFRAQAFASGIYVYRLQAGAKFTSRKMILLR
ncbi:MAG: T9SS type A sorting domain-containing protein [bacterium]